MHIALEVKARLPGGPSPLRFHISFPSWKQVSLLDNAKIKGNEKRKGDGPGKKAILNDHKSKE